MSSDIHFQALCSAVEHERIDKCRSILQASSAPPHRGVDLSALNNDGFSPLDLAFMTGRPDLVRLLLEHGATEGGAFPRPEAVSAHLHALAHESKKQVDKFGQLIKAAAASNNPSSTSTTAAAATAPQLSQSQLRECEKQQTLWQKRLATLKRLRSGFESSGRPHAPAGVEVSVVGPDCVSVRLLEPERVGGRSLYTKCRVQWSHSDSFQRVEGELTVAADPPGNGAGTGGKGLEFRVRALTEGRRYFVRASFGNPKGFGPFSASSPKSVVPSSWRSCLGDGEEARVPRIGEHQLEVCQRTFEAARAEFDGGFEPNRFGGGGGGAGGHHGHKRRGFRHLFSTSSAPKFQKQGHLAPGRIYLCCVFFHEDKVLMTNDENLPVMEADDGDGGGGNGGGNSAASRAAADLHWLTRLSSCWKDAERLRHEAAKASSNGGGHGGGHSVNRTRLLQTVLSMQQALGVTELGSPYHRPLTNPDGSVVLSLVNHIRNPKTVLSLSLKWVPLSKAQRRVSFDSQVSAMDALRYSLREQILFHQVCGIHLSPGLYLCYLQALSSLDSLRVVASSPSPSVPPYVRLRENPHVTCEEWGWLRRVGAADAAKRKGREESAAAAAAAARRRREEASCLMAPSPTTTFLANESEDGTDARTSLAAAAAASSNQEELRPTEAQFAFGLQLRRGMERLFEYLGIAEDASTDPEEGSGDSEPADASATSRSSHRICDLEIVEMAPDVSLIIVFPAPDAVCSMADRRPALDPSSRSDLLPVTLQVFEAVHLSSCHPETWRACCRASLHLEAATASARLAAREAFSAAETEECRGRVARLSKLQTKLEEAWRPARWLHDLISKAREKSAHCGVTYSFLCRWYDSQTSFPDDSARHYASLHLVDDREQQQQQQQQQRRKGSGGQPHRLFHNPPPRRDEESDALSQINAARPYDPAAPASASGTLTSSSAAAVAAAAASGGGGGGGGEHATTSAAGLLMASKGLTRTPTTRSDPLEFNIVGGGGDRRRNNKENNKENMEVRNFPRIPGAAAGVASGVGAAGDGHRIVVAGQQQQQPATSSSYSSLTLSQHSTNSSLSSNEQQQQQQPQLPQYENLPQQQQQQQEKRSFEPRVAQAGRFSSSNTGSSSSHQQQSSTSSWQSHNSSTIAAATASHSSSSTSPEPNVLQVFAAYETGLASGTSVRLNVTSATSAREVVDLVIKQLNMAVILKGREGPVYDGDRLAQFCLVAVIGNRERCLRDDFKPLNLQNPWKKGRLFVRMRNDLLAAIDHISRHSTVL